LQGFQVEHDCDSQWALALQVSKEGKDGVFGLGGSRRFKRWEWGRQISENDSAHLWSRFLTPLYGAKIIGLLANMTYSVRA
jgi:hypothetical protein